MKSKKVVRLEKKAKKMNSLVELTKLNDNDRKKSNNLATVDLPSPKRQCVEKNSHEEEERPKLEGEAYLELKRTLRERKKLLKQRPRIWLREVGATASLSVDIENRIPLFISDIQHLLMYSQIGQHSPYNPARWCQVDKPGHLQNTCVLIIENISMYDFVSNESVMPYISSKFGNKLEILNSNAYERSLIQDILMVPLTGTQLHKYTRKYSNLKEAAESTDELFDIVKNIFHIEQRAAEEEIGKAPVSDKFPRTDLLLSGWQMVEENFPLPIVGLMERKYRGYVTTKEEYKMVSASSPMFGIDCEMCKTTIGDLELTRVSLVDENHKVFYETLVKPHNKITDYLTRYSGITHQMMKDVTKRLSDVQEDLRKILPPDAILIGQSVNSDLHALKIFHPYIIDTSIIYNLTGQRVRKTKLQHLAKQFLNERIQEDEGGHCPTEDSLASLKLVQHKLTQNVYYGDAVMSKVQSDFVRYPDMANTSYATNMLRLTTKVNKTAAVYSTKPVVNLYRQWTFKKDDVPYPNIKFVEADDDGEVIERLSSSLKDSTLNIGHIQFTEHNPDGYSNIDRYVKQICENLEGPSLQVVIFSGHRDTAPSSGCAFLAVI